MSAQVYSVPDQTEGIRKAFLEWKSIELYFKLSLNVNCYKSVHHPFTIRGNREHPGNFENKSVSSPFNWVSRYIPFLAKPKGRERPFLEGARKVAHCEITPKSIWLSSETKKYLLLWNSPFVKILLDPLTNKHCKTWSSVISLWICFRTCHK